MIAASRGPARIRELPGVSIASAGVTFQMFNAAFLSAPVYTEAELTQRILLPSVHFNTRGLEWAYWVCEDYLEWPAATTLAPDLRAPGTAPLGGPAGHGGRTRPPPVKPPAANRSAARVRCAATRDAFCAIGSTCFHVPITWFSRGLRQRPVWEQLRRVRRIRGWRAGFDHGHRDRRRRPGSLQRRHAAGPAAPRLRRNRDAARPRRRPASGTELTGSFCNLRRPASGFTNAWASARSPGWRVYST